MSLSTYKEKRNLKKTPEPEGKTKKSLKLPVFVVQRHKATRLHYDFRIETNGVLKSWAVPKGPSMNPEDKRLAMMVEDHPFDYKDFEGIIPEGNYGAGIVEIWDSGTFSTIEEIKDKKEIETKVSEGIEKGSVKIHLYGEKLKGEFALVKTNNGYQKDAWLLIKHKDKFAVKGKYDSEEHTAADSPINKWLQNKKEQPHRRTSSKKAVIVQAEPVDINSSSVIDTGNRNMVKPMLAREVPEPFNDKDWIFEIKWDGYRAIAEIDNDKVSLYSRNGIMFNKKFPEVVKALQTKNRNMVLDGEIVLLNNEGKPDFGKLQDYQNNPSVPLNYYVFDILYIDRKNLCQLPLLERKKILRENLSENEVVRYTDHFTEEGIRFFHAVQKLDLEGIMAKKADSLYYQGRRVSSWLKIKLHGSALVFIAGFTEPAGGRNYFGSLILGRKEDGRNVYAGHVGTGFNESLLKKIHQLLKPLERSSSPFDIKIPARTKITWVEPKIMCEVKYTEITNAGIFRHPVFARLIDNVEAEKTNKFVKETDEEKVVSRTEEKKPNKKKNSKEIYNVDGNEVLISHPAKIYFPEENITKGELAEYYYKIAPYILPYLKNRPESLNRFPNGIHSPGFYHKNAGEKVPEWIDTYKVNSESSQREIEFILCNNKASLLYLINLGCIELNPWHSVAGKDDFPDYLVIDLDPSKDNTFSQVVEAAKVVKSVLDKAGADGYCKTSGATGMHIYIPLGARYSYEEAKNFAQLICMLTHEQIPEFTTLERNLSKRGKDKIYLDYLQNRRGQTIASVYSVRPHNGATVSTPLHWNELSPVLNPRDFNIHNTIQRIERMGDMFSGVLGKGIDMNKCLRKLSS